MTATKLFDDGDVEYFIVTEEDKMCIAAQQLRHEVYLEMGYIDSPFPDKIIPDTSIGDEYIVAVTGDQVVGTIRLTPTIFPEEYLKEWASNLKEEAFVYLEQIEKGISVITGALAVKKGFSGQRISWGVYKSSLLYSLAKPITHWVIAIDARALRAMDMVGWKIHRIGKPIMYMGSMSVLCVLIMNEQMPSFEDKGGTFYSFLMK